MPATTPMPTKNPGDVLTSTLWNTYLRDNIDKLLTRGHRVLTVAQFGALTGLEGTKGTLAPDEVYLEVDSANGIQWHLAYESGEPTYKWRFLGGPPMMSLVTTPESVTSVAYTALTTAGPSLALPRAGDYDVIQEAYVFAPTGAQAFMSYDIGGTGAVDGDATNVGSGSTTTPNAASVFRSQRKAGLTAVTLTSKYRSNSGAPIWQFRQIAVTPTRLI